MPAPETIRRLAARFEEHREAYRLSKYNEAQLRREFLDPLLEALGWDVFNTQDMAETFKEVIHEDSLEVEGAMKAPDYAFRVGGQRKFFVEAKKPSVNIESDIYPAFQLRRYSWSAKLPLGIVSDFEEFAVYDCRSKPDKKDKATTGRVAFYTYRDYVEKWDEIAAVFSRESVLNGSFDQYAEGVKGKKGTLEVDDAFLAEIERWRDALAKNFALRNPSLTTRELNYAVQMTIDRIIFLRICEDRGIEPYGRLKDVAAPTPPALSGTLPKSAGRKISQRDSSADLGRDGEGSVYAGLCQIFQQADTRYNSGLFHFKEEKEASSAADSLTLSLNVDNKVLREILGSLYYPESPYVFSEIPADILGQVYERFLGKVIRLTAGHQAKVDEKPEVRKAGGVYYTPTYIVEYIVKNTVGKLLGSPLPAGEERGGEGFSLTPNPSPTGRGGLTPREVSRLKILDPACGSGTFPLGAYQYLLDWHLKWYIENDPEKWAKGKNPAIFESTRSTPSAFGTSPKSAGEESSRQEGSADLGEARRGWLLTTAEKKRILLNNIYGVDIDPQAVEVTKLSLLLKVLENESEQTIGSQLALIQERALPDLGRNIKCGNSLIGPDYYDPAGRGEGHQLTMGFGDDEERYRVNAFDWKAEFPQVFTRSEGGFDAVIGNPPYRMLQPHNTETEILEYLRKKYLVAEFKMELFHMFLQLGISLVNKNGFHSFIIPASILNNVYAETLRKWMFDKSSIQIISVANEKVFADADVHTFVLVLQREDNAETRNKNEILTTWELNKKVSQLESINYSTTKQKHFSSLAGHVWNILITDKNANLILRLNSEYPKIGDISTINRGLITGDRDKYFSDKKLSKDYVPIIAGSDVNRYMAQQPSEYVLFIKPKGSGGSWDAEMHLAPHKIVARQIGTKPMASLIREPIAVTGNLFTVRAQSVTEELYILGIFNSRLIEYFWKIMFADFKSSFPQVTIFSLSQVPIRQINFSDPAEKAQHDKMVSLVERMLELTPLLSPQLGGRKTARTPQEQEMVKREIESTDRQIDRLVYELYGLTDEEIKIVEGTHNMSS